MHNKIFFIPLLLKILLTTTKVVSKVPPSVINPLALNKLNIKLKYIPFKEYIKNGLRENPWETQEIKYNIIVSHNDIKMQYGMFESKEGFELDDINTNGQWFFNGHLHNCGKLGDRAYNLGNVTGQNFSEDAYIFSAPETLD